MTDSFPRRSARTQRFTLGQPRSFTVAADGRRVAFLRSLAGDDPVNRLWVIDVATGAERMVADPRALLASGDEGELPAAERARRERAREGAGGITAYATDPDATVAAFALGGRLFRADLAAGTAAEVPAEPPVFDPRPSPDGTRLAWVRGRALVVDGKVVAEEDDENVSWGSAEFIAAEEMGRFRGYWWAPDSSALAVARVDTTPVHRWHVGDPAEPNRPPVELAYPAAGTPNALVSLHVIDLDGTRREIEWDHEVFPYLAAVTWPKDGPLTLVVQSRDQRRLVVLAEGKPVFGDLDPAWVDLVPGVPAWLDGRLVMTGIRDDTRRVLVDGEPLTPPGLHVRSVVHAGDGAVWCHASGLDPTTIDLYRVGLDGALERMTPGEGVHGGGVGGSTVVVTSSDLDHDGATTTVNGKPVVSYAETPDFVPRVIVEEAGPRRLRAVVLLPRHHQGGPLPVLLDPYGGPHAQRVLKTRASFWASQWLADQGFAVVVIDGRGTSGRGAEFERAVDLDLATPPLEDQVEGLQWLAGHHPELDLSRVAIRGWSFGGFLAALAVLRRPDVFHAAIAGAPVTDWRLYDTHYTERYLGLPAEAPEVYRHSSLLDDAPALERPLLLIHGLADDNVVAAHTLQLSRALLEAGRPHRVLPLSGVTHMTPQETVAENLLLLQVAFLKEVLG